MTLEQEYVTTAFEAVSHWWHLLPSDVERKLRLAKSLVESHGSPTADEMRQELGSNWVIARRTKRVVERYGEDVNCVTPKQYAAAERRAIEKRVGEPR